MVTDILLLAYTDWLADRKPGVLGPTALVSQHMQLLNIFETTRQVFPLPECIYLYFSLIQFPMPHLS